MSLDTVRAWDTLIVPPTSPSLSWYVAQPDPPVAQPGIVYAPVSSKVYPGEMRPVWSAAVAVASLNVDPGV